MPRIINHDEHRAPSAFAAAACLQCVPRACTRVYPLAPGFNLKFPGGPGTSTGRSTCVHCVPPDWSYRALLQSAGCTYNVTSLTQRAKSDSLSRDLRVIVDRMAL
eukprot:3669767-Rhodomonas_salina.1